MALQTEAAALPGSQFKPVCLSGIQMGAFGLNLKAPLKDQTQEAIDDPARFAKRKDQLRVIENISPQAWAQVDKIVDEPPTCEQLCPWVKK
jgi:hypothetical protein